MAGGKKSADVALGVKQDDVPLEFQMTSAPPPKPMTTLLEMFMNIPRPGVLVGETKTSLRRYAVDGQKTAD